MEGVTGSVLSKTRSVLHRVDLHGAEGNDYVTFERQLDEPDEEQRRLKLANADWRDMGCPDTVTITVEPGDKLNEGPSALVAGKQVQ